jgi:hypothetical protein
MPRYRTYRIKESPRESFRWAAHTGGLAVVKTRDYDSAEEIEAASPYAAWKSLCTKGDPLHPGDLLEELPGSARAPRLFIAKYIGFEPAEWFSPEVKAEAPASAVTFGESLRIDSESPF